MLNMGTVEKCYIFAYSIIYMLKYIIPTDELIIIKKTEQ